ncbi:MAG: alpha/beta hydrolase [Caulobacter sp.]|nr:alpha/beta hydrolase [Caulobacter sp.]
MGLLSFLAGLLLPALATQAATPTRFSVEVRGAGPDIILIPGLASSPAVWATTIQALEGRYRLHILQVNGFAGAPAGGNLQGPVVEGLVDELAAYIASSGLQRPAVIGHSMGGFAGLALARKHPDQISRLMVVDALPFFSVLINPMATASGMEAQASAVRANFLALSSEKLAEVQTATLARLVKSPERRAEALAWSLASDRTVAGQVTYEVMTTDLRPALSAIKTPVTVLFARDDSMGFGAAYIEPIFRTNYASLANVRLVRVDGALHFIMLDQPDAFLREVLTFLS